MTDNIGPAIVELMGHRRLAGHVSEQTIAGVTFLRVDVPTADGTGTVTQFYSPGAVYCITPTTAETMLEAAGIGRVAPVQRWELPANRQGMPDEDKVTDEVIDPF